MECERMENYPFCILHTITVNHINTFGTITALVTQYCVMILSYAQSHSCIISIGDATAVGKPSGFA